MKAEKMMVGTFSVSRRRHSSAVTVGISVMLIGIVVMAALVLPMGGIDPVLMLDTMRRYDVSAYAFYTTGTIVVSVGDADEIVKAARRIVGGDDCAEVGVTRGDETACVAVSIVCAADAWSVAQAVRRIYSALGLRASVAVCLTGYTNDSGLDAEMLASSGMRAAVRGEGEVYIGMPRIPLGF